MNIVILSGQCFITVIQFYNNHFDQITETRGFCTSYKRTKSLIETTTDYVYQYLYATCNCALPASAASFFIQIYYLACSLNLLSFMCLKMSIKVETTIFVKISIHNTYLSIWDISLNWFGTFLLQCKFDAKIRRLKSVKCIFNLFELHGKAKFRLKISLFESSKWRPLSASKIALKVSSTP